jgi:hypothetical protein
LHDKKRLEVFCYLDAKVFFLRGNPRILRASKSFVLAGVPIFGFCRALVNLSILMHHQVHHALLKF